MERTSERTGERDTPPRAVIADVAARAGVSTATVSRVLNGRPNVSAATRDAVLAQVRALGYVGNDFARRLSGGRTGLVGLMAPYTLGDYFACIIDGVAVALAAHDVLPVVCPTQHERVREVSLLEHLMHGTIDGALFIMPSESEAELAALRERGYPFVVIDPLTPLGDDIPVVSTTNRDGAVAAMCHLIALGHRHIGLISGPRGWCASVERRTGYRDALREAGLADDARLIAEADFSIEGGRRAAGRLLDAPDPPSAIFAQNDNMAIGTLRAARERGLRIPQDLSVVGFDDVELASVTTPALTTVRQPLEEMGHVASEMLCRILGVATADGDAAREREPGALRVRLPTRLLVRGSTAPPRRAT